MENASFRFVLICLILFTLCASCIPAGQIQTAQAVVSEQPKGYMSFVINTHDWTRAEMSADTILRFIDLFEKYNARGEFYLTAPLVEAYARQCPDVIERLKSSEMTVSYHIRPPHPAYPGFDEGLKKLDDRTLEQTLRDYETYRLDLATGNVDKSAPGGYAYVAQVMGQKPVVASPQTGDPRIRRTMLKIYAEMGAQMQVLYHEEGTAIDRPLVKADGMWVRPSDFSITRIPVTTAKGVGEFWWTRLGTPGQTEYRPVDMLKTQLGAWNASRPPYITTLIHENDLYASGTGWASIYYDRGNPSARPYNLNAPDGSKLRSKTAQEAIWKAYEDMLAYAAQNLRIVTSQDVVRMAEGG